MKEKKGESKGKSEQCISNWVKALILDDMRPEEVATWWVKNGRKAPWCGTVYTEADVMAQKCWSYLHTIFVEKENISIRKFCNDSIKNTVKRKKFTKLLRQVVALVKNPPEYLRKEWKKLDEERKKKIDKKFKNGVDAYVMSQWGDDDMEEFRNYRYIMFVGTNSDNEVNEMLKRKKYKGVRIVPLDD